MRSTGSAKASRFHRSKSARVFDKARETLASPSSFTPNSLSNLGGTALAASYGALSADHLEYLDEAGVKRNGDASGSVAVVLPGAFYTLRETRLPPMDLLAPAQGPDRAGNRLQPRFFAPRVLAADHEHGLHSLSDDPGRSTGRRHPRCRQGARA